MMNYEEKIYHLLRVFNVNQPFASHLFEAYFIALGVLLGGSLIGGLAAFLTGQPLMTEIARFSSSIRIWSIIAAIGGTFDTVYSFERGLLNGETKDIVKQFLLILTAMGGAQTGALLINWLTQEHV
ncbi:YtrH family sporulation protein [Mesobacillus subterraneus]|uniref:YtrH family sporulation protein n=1 Tax=Mesobacillus subterraneus TaxID=285983 RepID=UPI00274003AE|nr:YtrH family sporulation protein [Mesobacillus subterraneus]WLR56089.1 YtrH family sporulation protein [Mesobacillus subterraneus]